MLRFGRSRSHSLKVAATSAVSLLSDDVGPHMDAYEAILRRRPRVMSLNGERYGSPSRRDDLSISKTHRSPTLVHPIVRRHFLEQRIVSTAPVKGRLADAR